MKIVLLFRDSVEAKYLSNILNKNIKIDVLILENGKISNIRKVKRIFGKANFLQYPLKILDLASITLYSKYFDYKLSKDINKEGYNKFPKDIPTYKVDDANGNDCISLLKSTYPDIILVLGTSILKEEVLSIPKEFLLNIHGGIVPEYRNVHSDFWAFLNKDYDNIGVSIIYLDKGIDSGDTALKSFIEIMPGDGLCEIKKKNLRLAANLILEAIDKANQGTLERIKQDDSKKRFYKTPGFFDIIKIIKR